MDMKHKIKISLEVLLIMIGYFWACIQFMENQTYNALILMSMTMFAQGKWIKATEWDEMMRKGRINYD